MNASKYFGSGERRGGRGRMLAWALSGAILPGLATLAPAQDAEALRIFEQLDLNSDGVLTADEIPEERKQTFERLLRARDANQDGKVTKEEFLAERTPAATPEQPPRERGGRDLGAAFFDRLDQNGDGVLEGDEIPRPLKERLEREGQKLSITKEQFAEMGQRLLPREGERGPLRELLKQLDKDNNGKLSRDELPEGMRERLSELFDRLNVNEIDLQQVEEFAQSRRNRPDGDREGRRPDRAGEGRPGEGRPEGSRPPMDEPRPPREGERPPAPAFFKLLDENGDGRLSKSEMLRVVILFEELDRNGDGELDQRELMGAERPEPPRERGMRPDDRGGRPEDGAGPPRRPEGSRPEGSRDENRDRPRPDMNREGFRSFPNDQFFSQLDTNKDGFVSREEAPERWRERFEQMDLDGDGKLSQEEVGRAFGEMMRRLNDGRGPDGGPGRGGPGRRGPEGDRPDRPQRPDAEN